MAATRTFLQSSSSTANATSYTFSSENLGAADSDRRIIVGIGSRAIGTVTISSVTVGGVSADIVVQATNTTSNSDISGIAIASVPTGTIGDVVVTFSAGALRAGIALYRALGGDWSAASDTDSSTAADPSVNLDCPEDGFIIAASVQGNAGVGDTATWTGITEDYEIDIESNISVSGASDEFATEQTGLTLTCDWANVGARSAGVFASWGPASASGSIVPIIHQHLAG